MRNRRKRKFFRRKYGYILTLMFLLMVFSIGYAAISTTISVSGTSKMANSTWNVKFNNIQPVTGSVTPTTNPTISNNTSVSFAARLENPGDFYEFNIDVVNAGSIDAMIDGFTMTPTLTATQQKYFAYSVTYSDGVALADNQLLMHGTTETLKVRFEYLTSNDVGDYPEDDQSFNFNLSIDYVQKDSSAVERPTVSFATDSWNTIISNVRNNTIPAYYTVGSTKPVTLSIDLDNDGTPENHTYNLRIANNSTPAECSTTGFSQTACGFVLEFADVITTHRMSPFSTGNYNNGYGNVGGWQYSDMNAYLNSGKFLEGTANEIDYTNGGIFNALPSVLRDAIIDTYTVSGYGANDSVVITSTDKLYLLSTHEVWVDVDNNAEGGIDYLDNGYNYTRQLDYYKNNSVTVYSFSNAVKKLNGEDSTWWLRSPKVDGDWGSYFLVRVNGYFSNNGSAQAEGVSPAFRLG